MTDTRTQRNGWGPAAPGPPEESDREDAPRSEEIGEEVGEPRRIVYFDEEPPAEEAVTEEAVADDSSQDEVPDHERPDDRAEPDNAEEEFGPPPADAVKSDRETQPTAAPAGERGQATEPQRGGERRVVGPGGDSVDPPEPTAASLAAAGDRCTTRMADEGVEQPAGSAGGAATRPRTGRLRKWLAKLPFAGRLLRPSETGAGGLGGDLRQSQGGGTVEVPLDGAYAAKPSPEEVERRLKLALRETNVEGFSRICVGSPKGGVGKSSIAYALAGAIAYYTNIRVCLIDADPEFGATRMLVPRPVEYSIVEMARDADELYRLSDIRGYVAQNERMRLDVVLNPAHMVDKTAVEDLSDAYERIDTVLSRFYDLVIYDMGLGFSHPQIQKVLSLSNELLLVGDSEVVPNAMLADALSYIQGLDVDLDHAGLCVNHRLPQTDESATTGTVKGENSSQLRRVTEVPYDAAFSQLLNRRAFHIEELSQQTRLGVLTTAAACLEGVRSPPAGRHAQAAAPASLGRKG